MKGYITIDNELCKGCKYCVEFCPKKVIHVASKLNLKGYYIAEFKDKNNDCTGCAICALMCPEAAIEVYRE